MADVIDELKRLETMSLLAAERHYAGETRWYNLNEWLGIPATLVSAITAASAVAKFDQKEIVTVTTALLASALSALLTFLDPFKRASAHHLAGREFEALYHMAGRLSRLDADPIKGGPIADKFSDLARKFDDLLKSSPAIPGYAYGRARRALASGNGEVLQPIVPALD